MIIIWAAIILVVAYTLDYKTALINSRKNWDIFENAETNKHLVYALMKDKKNPGGETKKMHITNISGWVLISLLFGLVGSIFFDFSFYNSAALYVSTQAVANTIGMLSNAKLYLKLKGMERERRL